MTSINCSCFISIGLVLGLSLLASCHQEPLEKETSEPLDTGDFIPLESLFSFVVIADTHMYGSGDHAARASAAVNWVNEKKTDRDLRVVIIVGDIAWSAGFKEAPPVFEPLLIPWVPLMGDNEIQSSDEALFDSTWGPQYERLASELEGWGRASTPVHNPDYDISSWLQNMSFQVDGVHFVGLDWASRTVGGFWGETADLHDWPGGTLPFLEQDLASLNDPLPGSVVLFSHHPMHLSPGSFIKDEMNVFETRIGDPWGQAIDADYAGHYHLNGDETVEQTGWDVHVTEDTFEDIVTVRVVEVLGNGRRYAFTQELVDVGYSSK